ncbi:MAG: hypothetical protein JNK68_12445 [Betaproteobacteria bacterium]|nr:hypothetical protein [Betaproteobacteria bacterium]
MNIAVFGLASLVAASVLPAPALAADWQLVATAKEGTIYVDAHGIVLKDKLRRAWDKWQYTEDQPGFPGSGIRAFRASKHLAWYNCEERSFAVAEVIYLDAKGKSVGQITLEVDVTSFTPVAPDSVSESQLDFVCKSALKNKP